MAYKTLHCRVKPAASTCGASPPSHFITFREKLSLEFFSPSIKDGGLQVYDYFSYCRIAPAPPLRPRPLLPRLLRILAPGASFGHSQEEKKGPLCNGGELGGMRGRRVGWRLNAY